MDSDLHNWRCGWAAVPRPTRGAEVNELQPSAVTVRPKSTLQGRIILYTLLISFPFLALTVMEQGRVIDSQRTLIRQLLGDSMELTKMKMKTIQEQNAAKNPAPAPQPQVNRGVPPSEAMVVPERQAGAAATPQARTRTRTHETQPAPKRPQPRVIDLTHRKAI